MEGGLLTGRLPAELANQVSESINAAIRRGANTDEACCVAAQVVADYWRAAYGNLSLATLCKVVLQRGESPLPSETYAPKPEAGVTSLNASPPS